MQRGIINADTISSTTKDISRRNRNKIERLERSAKATQIAKKFLALKISRLLLKKTDMAKESAFELDLVTVGTVKNMEATAPVFASRWPHHRPLGQRAGCESKSDQP